MELVIEDLDFFQIKLLESKKGTLYVRDGKGFIYQGSDKYHLTEGHPGEFDTEGEVDLLSKGKPMTFDKDIKIDGYFWMWQSDEYFVLVFIDSKRKQQPVLLRAGNALDALKEKGNE